MPFSIEQSSRNILTLVSDSVSGLSYLHFAIVFLKMVSTSQISFPLGLVPVFETFELVSFVSLKTGQYIDKTLHPH